MRERRCCRQDSNSGYEADKAWQYAPRNWAGAHAFITTITEKQAKQGNGRGRRWISAHWSASGGAGVLTPRNLPSGSEPRPGQDGHRASETRVRKRTPSLTGRTSRRVRGTKAPPTSGAQRLAQVRPHFYWRSCGACVPCSTRVRSVCGRFLSVENRVPRRNSRLEVFRGGWRERRKRPGEPGLAPAQWGCVSEFPGPRGCLGAAVGRSLLSHLSQNLVSPHVSRCEPPFGPVNSVAKLPKGPLKVLCPSSPADKAKVLRNYRWFTQKKISFL